MSGGVSVLSLKAEDVAKLLAASTHIGTTNCDFQMEQYVYKRRSDGVHLINLAKTWEKLMLAARAIAAVDNPADVCVLSSRPTAQRALFKFAYHTGSSHIAGRFTPGTFTNQVQPRTFREPRLLVVMDSRVDHQAVLETSFVNLPVIAFCNTDSPVRHVDIAIPCNNKGNHSVGLMWWLLAREVLRLRGKISRELPWDIMVDLYFHREAEEQEKEELVEAPAAPTAKAGDDWTEPSDEAPVAAAPATAVDDWNPALPTPAEDWSANQAEDWGAPAASNW